MVQGGRVSPKSGKPSPDRGIGGISATLNTEKVGVHTVSMLVVGNIEFVALVDNVYSTLVAVTDAQGADFSLDREDLMKYFATAVYSRVAYVTRERRPIVRPEDMWALPAPMAYALNAIGRVELGNGITVVPQWVESAEQTNLLLSRDDVMRISRVLRALEPLGFRFVRQMEKSRDGDPTVMSIVPTYDDRGEVIFTSHTAATGIHFVTAAVLGFQPVEVPDGIPRMWLPDYTMAGRRLVTLRERYASMEATT